MNSPTANQLVDLNRRFYTERSKDFSETRRRLQPGVERILHLLGGDETILDLGCGNGQLARALSDRGHHGTYLGLDFSVPLLGVAKRESFCFPVHFLEADLTTWAWPRIQELLESQASIPENQLPLSAGTWSTITAFAVLHHIPTRELRLDILKTVRHWLAEDGRFVHSNWQFLSNPRNKARIQPWEAAGLTDQDVDAKDFVLDWRRGGKSLRYVHLFDEAELTELANTCGFEIAESYHSDGFDGKSALYQVWICA